MMEQYLARLCTGEFFRWLNLYYHCNRWHFVYTDPTMTNGKDTYNFSFTGAALKFHDFIRLAKYVDDNQLDLEKENPDPGLIMRRSNARTNQREFQEMMKRYLALTPHQRNLIAETDANSQKHLALLGFCKANAFIRDFIVEVVREKFLSLDYQLTDGDYLSFFNRKMELHPELEQFAESTTKKARQVTWRILEEAGLIDNTKDRIVLPQFVNQRVISAVASDNPALLKIFLMTDREIKDYTA